MLTLHWHNRMAARVALEVERIDRFGVYQVEGLAYKAQWDERGSDAGKHCLAHDYDYGIMCERVRHAMF